MRVRVLVASVVVGAVEAGIAASGGSLVARIIAMTAWLFIWGALICFSYGGK